VAAAHSPNAPARVALEPAGKATKLAYSAEPGAEVEGAVLVQNGTGRARPIALSAVDVGTAALGGAVYGEAPGKRTGSWLTLSMPSVDVAPHSARLVPFRIHIPRDAEAGVHYAGITAIDAEQLRATKAAPSRTAKRIVVHRLARFALPVKIRVQGGSAASHVELRGAEVAVDAAGSRVILKLENTGHTLVRSTRVDLRLKRGDRTLFTASEPLKEFVPDSVASYAMPWPGAPERGEYRLVGEVRPAGAPVIAVDERLQIDGDAASAARRAVGARGVPANDGIGALVWFALAGATMAAALFGLALVRMRRRLIAATAQQDVERR
jgi:hypothetical protein